MKHFFKTLLIITLLFGSFQSCTSEETKIEITSDEKVSSNLLDLMRITAETKSDYNLINFDCEDANVSGGFLNNQGDYYGGIEINIALFNDELMSDFLEDAYLDTGIRFTKDDFTILSISTSTSTIFGDTFFNKNDIINYFEDCSLEGDEILYKIESIKVSDVNFSCSGVVSYFIDGVSDNSSLFSLDLEDGVGAVEEALSIYNETNNTTYTLDDLRSNYMTYTSPQGTSSFTFGKTQIINYFEDCVLNKSTNDCINFKYPFVINKINLQTEEVIPVTVADDTELFQQNLADIDITLEYPITLVTLNGSEFVVNSNNELEDALTNSESYCTNGN